jgi:CDP-L-myo-inositol myo-inositolphosphotransferase
MNSYTAYKYDKLMKKNLTPGKHYLRIGRDIRIFILILVKSPNYKFFI